MNVRTSTMRIRYRRKDRRVLKNHLDAQYRRGYSGPNARPIKKLPRIGERIARRKQAMREFQKTPLPPPPTLADVWPSE